MPVPVTITPYQVQIQADRRLVFQYLTAFGVGGPGSRESSKVLRDEGNRKLVEFHLEVRGLFGGTKRVRTVEWVTLNEPESIDFEGVTGPLPLLLDRFELEEDGGCTVLRYRSTVGAHGWVFGWPIAMLIARPMVKRHMRAHLAEVKERVEARARRSRVYPQRPCLHEAPPEPVPAEVIDAAK